MALTTASPAAPTVASATQPAAPSTAHTIGIGLVLLQTAAVWYTAGFVWTLQRMDYPMIAKLRDGAAYMDQHNQMFWLVLAPGLAVAGVTAVLALVGRPFGVPLVAAVAGVVLLVVIIVLSGKVATPDRESLARHFSRSTYDHLIMVSWIRTLAFTAWGVLDLWLVWRIVRGRVLGA